MSPLARLSAADWSKVPHNLHHQIEAYILDGKPPTSPFLGDILCGDLRRACSRVPDRDSLFAIVDFLGLHAPAECWGHAGACVRWGELGGHRGIENIDANRMYEVGGDRRRGPVKLWRPGRANEEE